MVTAGVGGGCFLSIKYANPAPDSVLSHVDSHDKSMASMVAPIVRTPKGHSETGDRQIPGGSRYP